MKAAASILLLLTLSSGRCESNYSYEYYPSYHLGPLITCQTEVGWMNDPNGLCLFKNEYHMFYQYNPNSSLVPGIAHWGHATSKDLINWEHEAIALSPDEQYDRDGVFSGSALVENDTMYLYYTGNINHPGQSPDHEQHQCLATSEDGHSFTKYKSNPIIIGENRQPNFRDPKVWKYQNAYYMVLGNSYNNDSLGQVLLYRSEDKIAWSEVAVLDKSDGFLGYMWECPDFFPLNNRFVLMISPQGVGAEGDDFNNLYSTGYITGRFDYATNNFYEKSQYKELDHGHDFYATQTLVNREGQRVLIAWMDMWDQNYPEGPDGFTGQMTIPRVLSMTKDGHILQRPVQGMEDAVGDKLFAGHARSGTKVKLATNAAKVEVTSLRKQNFELLIESESANDTVKISYNYKDGRVTLDRGGRDGVRRTKYRPSKFENFHMVVFIDYSSIEVFFGKGEVTMSSRFFPKGLLNVLLGQRSRAQFFKVNAMKRTIISPKELLKRC